MSRHYTITIRLISAIILVAFLFTQTAPGYALDSGPDHSHIRSQAVGETSVAKGIGEDLQPKKQSTVSKSIAEPVPDLSPAVNFALAAGRAAKGREVIPSVPRTRTDARGGRGKASAGGADQTRANAASSETLNRASEEVYGAEAFTRKDSGADSKYWGSHEEKITFISDSTRGQLKDKIEPLLPQEGLVLDIMSGEKIVFYKRSGRTICGIGINEKLLKQNHDLDSYILQDLNENPSIEPASANKYDVVIVSFGVAYFIKPLEVLRAIHRLLKPGGKIIIVGSPQHYNNDKSTKIWLNPTSYAALYGVTDHVGLVKCYLQQAGGFGDIDIQRLNIYDGVTIDDASIDLGFFIISAQKDFEGTITAAAPAAAGAGEASDMVEAGGIGLQQLNKRNYAQTFLRRYIKEIEETDQAEPAAASGSAEKKRLLVSIGDFVFGIEGIIRRAKGLKITIGAERAFLYKINEILKAAGLNGKAGEIAGCITKIDKELQSTAEPERQAGLLHYIIHGQNNKYNAVLNKIAIALTVIDKEGAKRDFDDASNAADSISDLWLRAMALSKIAQAKQKSGYYKQEADNVFKKALESARRIVSDQYDKTQKRDKSWVLCQIAMDQAEVGLFTEAIKTLETEVIMVPEFTAEAFSYIAKMQAGMGISKKEIIETFVKALVLCDEISKENGTRDKVCDEIMTDLIKTGVYRDYKETGEELDSSAFTVLECIRQICKIEDEINEAVNNYNSQIKPQLFKLYLSKEEQDKIGLQVQEPGQTEKTYLIESIVNAMLEDPSRIRKNSDMRRLAVALGIEKEVDERYKKKFTGRELAMVSQPAMPVETTGKTGRELSPPEIPAPTAGIEGAERALSIVEQGSSTTTCGPGNARVLVNKLFGNKQARFKPSAAEPAAGEASEAADGRTGGAQDKVEAIQIDPRLKNETAVIISDETAIGRIDVIINDLISKGFDRNNIRSVVIPEAVIEGNPQAIDVFIEEIKKDESNLIINNISAVPAGLSFRLQSLSQVVLFPEELGNLDQESLINRIHAASVGSAA